MNYYPKNVGDYARDTLGLTQGQHGAYNLLIDACYASEDGVAADEVYGISKAATPAERRNTDKVLAKYFERRDERYYQKRIDEEVSRFREKSGKAASAASKRWGKPPPEHANAMRTHVPTQSNRSADGGALAMPIQNLESITSSTVSTVIETSPPAREPQLRGGNSESKPRATTRSVAKTQRLLQEQRAIADSVAPMPETVRKFVKPNGHAQPLGDGAEPAWWETPAGMQRVAMEHGVKAEAGEPWEEFQARVLASVGPGPWLDCQPDPLRARVEHYRAVGVNP